jgi:hypothetical protein
VAAAATASKRDAWSATLVAALLLLSFLLGCFPMGDFDIWWHLGTGRLILERGAVPRVDVFTYTNAGRPWIDLYWFFQIIVALLDRAGGVRALVLLKALVGTATVALALAARRPGSRVWPACAVWLPAVVVFTGHLNERPELFSLLFLAAFLAVLARAPERPRLLWVLPLIELVWVNSHGFFILGLFVLVAFAAERIFDHARRAPDAAAQPPLRIFLLASGATIGACLVNPYGWRAVQLPLEQFHKLGGTGIYRENIGELKSIGDFIARAGVNNPYLLGSLLLLALGLASFGFLFRRVGFRPFRTLLFVAFAYLGWQATRNSALFALVVAVVTAWNIEESLVPVPANTAPLRGRRSRRPDQKASRPARNMELAVLVGIGLLAIATLSGGLYAWAGEGRSIGLGERQRWYAHEACEFLSRKDTPERIAAFNLGQAAVCIAHTGERHKQFMDPRLEVNSPETFERYLAGIRALWHGDADWGVPLGIDPARPDEMPALLIERGVLGRAISVLAHDPLWRCVHADPVAVVFVASAFAEAHHLPAVSP